MTTIPKPAGLMSRQASSTGTAVVDTRLVAIAHCHACPAEYEVGVRDADRPDDVTFDEELAIVATAVQTWTDRHLDTCTGSVEPQQVAR